ncbi:SPO22-domain-containing protein [Xylariaceae sp. AK1471]|nr:SPO22-domain-containing protein [Xylariaceae sp. AK1471]
MGRRVRWLHISSSSWIILPNHLHPERGNWSIPSFVRETVLPSNKLELIFQEFASDLRAQALDEATDSSLQDLNHEIEDRIHALKPHSSRSLSAQHHDQLNTAGLALWNWCTQGKRREGDQSSPVRDKFFTLARVLSFLMLTLALQSDDNSPKAIIHLERLATKTGRSCIANNELDFALWALQKAVEYNGLLQRLQASSPEEGPHTCSQFEAEYSTLRIVLAWKEDRMDVAEHLYASFEKLMQKLDPASIEKLTDALFEIGKDLARKKNSVLAVKWLERAYELINAQEIGQLSRDAIELRLAISQALIQVYLDMGTPDCFDRAENHIAYIESELGDKLIVLLFRIEVLLRSPAEIFDGNAYADILRRMMRTFDMSESSFKLLMHHVRKLDETNNLAASSALDEFLMTCILATQREQWIDKAIILRIHMAVHEGSIESIQALEAVLDQVQPRTGKPLSVNTAAGIQTLIWKKADAEFNQEQFESAAKWCQLALHSALEQSETRKLLLCAIHQNDLSTAADILRTMSEGTLKEPMTAYLAFKVALKQKDVATALGCLKQVSEASAFNHQYLYACCLEAQQAQDKISTIEALRHLVLKHQSHSPSPIHLPALLRVLIRLEVSVLGDEEQTDTDRESLVEDLCNIFKAAVNEIQKERRDGKTEKLFTIDELNWFCKNAYNLGLENTMVWEARHVICILECCLSIISCYPADVSAQTVADICLRGMFCNFMVATVLLALARSEDNIERRLEDYLDMRRHVQRFQETLELRSETLDEASREDLHSKLSILLDDLKGIILRAQTGQNLSAYQAMADCILRCQSVPAQVLYQTMRELVNQIWELEHFDTENLAKYMRCLLKATLPMEHKIPLHLIEEICTMIKLSESSKRYFPPRELEWITITAFNHGVDLYGSHEDELSKAWVSHALTLAHYLRDGGELERQLQDKYTKLKWDDTQAGVNT